jgi:glucose-1-phosphate thymidylyltransferase
MRAVTVRYHLFLLLGSFFGIFEPLIKHHIRITNSRMRAIIPVAGIGSRLRPHTFTVPKVLLNVAGKPILGHILDKIIGEGITEATIIVGNMSEMVVEYVGTTYPALPVEYVEQTDPMGLGHAIYLAREGLTEQPVLIILGDTIFDVDLTPILRGPESAIGVKEVEDPRRFGVAETLNGYITRLVEKPENPTSNLAVVGLYYLRHGRLLAECLDELVRNDIRTKGEYQLTDALQMMLARGEKIRTFMVEGWYDCGKPETLLATNRALLMKRPCPRQIEGVVIHDPVCIAPTAELQACVIGPFTTVADHAVVKDSVIRNSIVGERAQVERALLDNSIIGNSAVVKGAYKRLNVGDSSEIEMY